MILEKYSMGVGDRFGHQARAQLQAMFKAREQGVEIAPVWNKSFREHHTIQSKPADVTRAARAAVQAMDWDGAYHIDADHIGLGTVDAFIESSDFFTLDVADFTGRAAPEAEINAFVDKYSHFDGELAITGINEPLWVCKEELQTIARKYLLAIQEAGRIYRHIAGIKGAENFITEVSMDETDAPQKPLELLFILAAIAEEDIPAQTIAPKFTGRFNKGVDYVGDVSQFTREFEGDLAVIDFAIEEFGLPQNLKLSVHSGSDKFSIYTSMAEGIRRFASGLHLKTAGTTWLEELIGLAMAEGEGLEIARAIYRQALGRFDELCKPYATVIDINRKVLPDPDAVDRWDGERFAQTLRHERGCDRYNPDFRQLLHVGYKVAAEMGERYTKALEKYEPIIAPHVTHNIYDRHIQPLFVDPVQAL